MSLIFDRFPSRDKAESFVAAIQKEFGLSGGVFDDEASAFWFPFHLNPPIVLIDRSDPEIERAVEDRVTPFGGEFAGT